MNEVRSKAKEAGSRKERKGISLFYMPLLISLFVCILALTVPASVKAAVFHVAAGDVDGLVAAIKAANSNRESNHIVLEPGVYTLMRPDNNIDGPNGLPSITGVITISTGTLVSTSCAIAPTSCAFIERLAVSNVPDFRIFHVSSGALGLINVVVTGGQGVAQGGGLFNRGRTTVLINSVIGQTIIPPITGVIRHNEASAGGGIFNSDNDGLRSSVLVLVGGSTVDGNTAHFGGGGGILNRGTLVITDSTISHNFADFVGGGGIKNNGGIATLERSTVDNNTAEGGGNTGGGGIENLRGGALTITNSTISGNKLTAGGNAPRGGGIRNAEGATLNLSNVTITNNQATSAVSAFGGGIANDGSTVNFKNTVIAHNTPDECSGTALISQGFNLVGNTEPLCPFIRSTGDQLGQPSLGALFNYGGLTETHSLLEGSPGIDEGNPAAPGSSVAACDLVDQRRFRRPFGAACDIGAFELNASPEVTRTGPATTVIMANMTLDQDQTRGIVIGRDDIVLDCNGHKIEGLRDGAGIELKVRKGVTVRNCVVTNFANGFNIENSTLNIIVHNTVTNNRNDGFHIVRSDGNIFDENTAAANGDDGFDLAAASANFFRSNLVQENEDRGFNLDLSLGNFFVNNRSEENGDRGFRVSQGSRYNLFVDDTVCNNHGRVDFEENSHPNFFGRTDFCTAFGIRPRERF